MRHPPFGKPIGDFFQHAVLRITGNPQMHAVWAVGAQAATEASIFWYDLCAGAFMSRPFMKRHNPVPRPMPPLFTLDNEQLTCPFDSRCSSRTMDGAAGVSDN
ncbi:hypothetical protein [Bosea thiooxidans]